LRKCLAITQGGERCKGVANGESGYCYAHDPRYQEDRKRAASKGGKRGGRGRPKIEVQGIKQQLQELANSVLDGSVERADASVASQILNVLLRAITVEAQIREQQEFAERLESLEEAISQQRGRRTHGA
jgi:LPS O-antigen subunit length determinant protein (WzzB/FepE family)